MQPVLFCTFPGSVSFELTFFSSGESGGGATKSPGAESYRGRGQEVGSVHQGENWEIVAEI